MATLPRQLVIKGDISASGGNSGNIKVDIGIVPLLIYGGNISVTDANGTVPIDIVRDVFTIKSFKYDDTEFLSESEDLENFRLWLTYPRFRPFILKNSELSCLYEHTPSSGSFGANQEFPVTVTTTLFCQRLTSQQSDAYERALHDGGVLAGLGDGVEKFGDLAQVIRGVASLTAELRGLLGNVRVPQQQQYR